MRRVRIDHRFSFKKLCSHLSFHTLQLCTLNKTAIIPMTNAFTVKEWMKESEKFHLTINDVLKLDAGKPHKLLHLDRNFYELIDHNAEKGVHKASKITRGNYFSEYIKTKDNDIAGSSKWLLDTKDAHTDATRWHVDLGHIWYPLNDEGTVPKFDKDGIYDLGTDAGKHWTALSKETHMGWRGPCMLAADVDKVGYMIL